MLISLIIVRIFTGSVFGGVNQLKLCLKIYHQN